MNQKSDKITGKKEYFNKLSLERINFKFEDYQIYPEHNMKPSIFFFKFLCPRPDSEKDCKKLFTKL
jgi:hypothetical protein